MQKKKTLKLTAIVVIVVAMMMALVEGSGLAVQEDGTARQTERFEFAGVSMPLDRRAGTDDGLAFAIHFTGDTHGSLDACG